MKHPKQVRAYPRPKRPDLPFGVYWRNKTSPYIVKFWEHHRKKHKTVGSFMLLADATSAAEDYLRTNR